MVDIWGRGVRRGRAQMRGENSVVFRTDIRRRFRALGKALLGPTPSGGHSPPAFLGGECTSELRSAPTHFATPMSNAMRTARPRVPRTVRRSSVDTGSVTLTVPLGAPNISGARHARWSAEMSGRKSVGKHRSTKRSSRFEVNALPSAHEHGPPLSDGAPREHRDQPPTTAPHVRSAERSSWRAIERVGSGGN